MDQVLSLRAAQRPVEGGPKDAAQAGRSPRAHERHGPSCSLLPEHQATASTATRAALWLGKGCAGRPNGPKCWRGYVRSPRRGGEELPDRKPPWWLGRRKKPEHQAAGAVTSHPRTFRPLPGPFSHTEGSSRLRKAASTGLLTRECSLRNQGADFERSPATGFVHPLAHALCS